MKKLTKLNAFVLSVAMAVAMLLPMTMNAQSDGFFRDGGGDYSNRTGSSGGYNLNNQQFGGPSGGITNQTFNQDTPSSGGITNQTFNQEAPLGSGLLMMLAAGIGYAVLKKERTIVKQATIKKIKK